MTIEEQPDTAQALRDAIETLESIVRDRSVLQGLSVEERTRLLAAAGDVFNPSVVERRRGVKNERKRQKAEKTSRDERLRAETGIRVLREKPVFTTPNYARPQDEPDEPARRCRGPVLLRLQAAHTHRYTTSTTRCAGRAATSTSRSEPRRRI